ncbi:lipid A export permease/ATP-binding protein MsbA [Luminiphilus syltensis NOR5-1B]|uniref:Lipid A export permease/ATP-binding protein MsbA n=2 Tax=Luminiphilus TaxID=1341118 RepID=B8KYJ5_9GAMM|nr:lipid A export permease/ATP-binding protein MsbA [Luminiphilus syltensis NOR5-1B]
MEGASSPKTASDWALYGRLLRYVRPYVAIFCLSIVGFIVYSAGNVLLADLTQFLLDSLGESTPGNLGIVASVAHAIWPPGDKSALDYARIAVPVAAVVLSLGRALGYFAGNYFMNRVARSVIHDLRTQLFDVLIRVPKRHHDHHSSGALISKITFNVEQVSGAASDALKVILREGLTITALVSYMLFLNWRLSLIFFAVAPAIGIVVVVVGRHFRRYSRRIQDSMGSVTEVTSETMTSFEEVRMFEASEQQSRRFRDASRFNRNQSLKLALVEAISTPVIQTLLALALGSLFWFALDPTILAGFSAGSLVAFLTAAAQLGKPIRTLSGIQSVIQRGLAAAEDVFSQIDTPPEPDRGHIPLQRARGDISLRSVFFSYPGSERHALQDVSIDIPAGETVAFVGRSGSGKTTLVQLLARFYPIGSGQISLDGVPIEHYALLDYRRQIAMVSQHVVLFADTVRNNIAFGALRNSPESAVREAARAANALDFIERLPQGFDTLLGDAGAGLSGGQRQRLAIARAFLKDAPILVLDEATSALDNESEAKIQDSVNELMRDKTTLIIAHRLSTVEAADRVVVLDAGRVVAQGTHRSLLAEEGLYASLYRQSFNDV